MGLGCAPDRIDHGSPSDVAGSTDPSASASGATVTTASSTEPFGDSNFPEPALTQCGGLGNMSLPIDRLNSAWGVEAVAGGGHEPGSIRVRLSEQALFDCQEPFGGSCDEGSSSGGFFGSCGWGFAFTLSPAEAKLSQVLLEDLSDPQFQLDTEHGGVEVLGAVGDLELYRVTQECIVGDLSNVTLDLEPVVDIQSLDGGFVAQLCGRTCLPTAEVPCD
jgi:hypothetical protein